jgi:hypothetical protein
MESTPIGGFCYEFQRKISSIYYSYQSDLASSLITKEISICFIVIMNKTVDKRISFQFFKKLKNTKWFEIL